MVVEARTSLSNYLALAIRPQRETTFSTLNFFCSSPGRLLEETGLLFLHHKRICTGAWCMARTPISAMQSLLREGRHPPNIAANDPWISPLSKQILCGLRVSGRAPPFRDPLSAAVFVYTL